MIKERRIFQSAAQLAEALAQDVAHWLRLSIAEKNTAVLAVSGGSTPKMFFTSLSKMELDWSKVMVTLVDERQVPEDDALSNAKLVKETLIQNRAATAQFVPLYENPVAQNNREFDVVILGMGNDGHTASFFPDGRELKNALDLSTRDVIIEMNAPGAGVSRLTFTLKYLLGAKHLYLHIQGDDKMKVLEAALAGTDTAQMPVRAVLHAPKPTILYWCP